MNIYIKSEPDNDMELLWGTSLNGDVVVSLFCVNISLFALYPQTESLEEIKENISSMNQHKAPSHYINDYAVLELLGTGGFGSVYKVKKKSAGQSYLALKEVKPFFCKTLLFKFLQVLVCAILIPKSWM